MADDITPTGRVPIPHPDLDLRSITQLVAMHLAARDDHLWDNTPEPWANLGHFHDTYLAEAAYVIGLIVPAIEHQVLEHAVRRYEHLQLAGATVVIAEEGARIAVAYREHLTLEQAMDRRRRLQFSLPANTIAIIVDGVEVGFPESADTETQPEGGET